MIKTQIANLTLILTTGNNTSTLFQILNYSNFHFSHNSDRDRVAVVMFSTSHQEVLWKSGVLKSKPML